MEGEGWGYIKMMMVLRMLVSLTRCDGELSIFFPSSPHLFVQVLSLVNQSHPLCLKEGSDFYTRIQVGRTAHGPFSYFPVRLLTPNSETAVLKVETFD